MAPDLPLPWTWTIKIWSSVLGYGSIGFWVFAQVPQILENIRLQSCEGLALPFLMNWFIGDLCNLIGCLLTDQRAFQASLFLSRTINARRANHATLPHPQTWTATYFCMMDVGLTGQYFYYTSIVRKNRLEASRSRSRSRSRTHGPRDATVSAHSQARLRPSTIRNAHASADTSPNLPFSLQSPTTQFSSSSAQRRHLASLKRHASYLDESDSDPVHQAKAEGSGITLRGHRDGSMAALQEAAMDVARAAARLNRSRSRRAGSHGTSLERSGFGTLKTAWRKKTPRRRGRTEGDDGVDLDGDMMESFHSDMSSLSAHNSGSGAEGNGHAKWQVSKKGKERSVLTKEELEALPSPALSPEVLSHRGRSLQRPLTLEGEEAQDTLGSPHLRYIAEEAEDDVVEPKLRKKRKSKSRSRSILRGTGDRAAGVVFMGVFALVGWGGLQSGEQPFGKGIVAWEGSVVPERRIVTWPQVLEQRNVMAFTLDRELAAAEIVLEVASEGFSSDRDQPKHYPEHPDIQRIIGRSSAWICTTLYLTSRLPQIWKNFERKSTEGLSVLLFVFAFMGNFTYVLSILLNPTGDADPAETAHYLLEALPYLLGSGGTLIFDLTIMLQTYMYGTNHPQQDALDEERSNSVASRSRKRLAASPSDDERRPLIRERSVDGPSRRTWQYSQHGGKASDGEEGQGHDVTIPSREGEAFQSGEVTPRPGRLGS